MKFGSTSVSEAEGAVVAHRVKTSTKTFYKGHVLSADDLDLLRQAGIDRVVVAQLEPDDVGEDEAALRISRRILGPGVRMGRGRTGRVNLFAERDGLLRIGAPGIDRANGIHEGLTVATLEPFAVVRRDQMVATVKVIPFGVANAAVEAVETVFEEPSVEVLPFLRVKAGLILTELPGTPERQLDQALRSQQARLRQLGGGVVETMRVPHTVDGVTGALETMDLRDVDLVMALGASAITDRRDVIPQALEETGGTIVHLGMPVDPGNLLLVGRLPSARPLLGLPGCARSTKPSGFDWVLHRLAAGLDVKPGDIMGMGVGGLLTEVETRPQPRQMVSDLRETNVAAVVLAAGSSRRMGAENKLLLPVRGRPMIQWVLAALRSAGVEDIIVVTGHDPEAIGEVVAGAAVRLVHNPDFGQGMSTSLKAGFRALPASADAALVALGDMPFVDRRHVELLVRAYRERTEASIFVPVFGKKRGHPVLWDRRHFAEMEGLEGDQGARTLLDRHGERARLVPVEDDGIHVDIDTPQAWARLGGRTAE